MRASPYPIILTYHSISEGRSPLKISPALFAGQMEWLKANCRVASLGEVVRALEQRNALPDRTVVLTFDDGFRDFHESAALVLRRLGLPAIVFLPTAFCGRTNSWPGQPSWVDEQPLLDWDQVAALAGQGFLFGAHSRTHRSLTGVPAAEAREEISGSRQEIEAHTGRPVEFFCYPYGRWDAGVRAMVREYYRGACSTAAGVVEPNADSLALPRVDAHYVRHPAWFRRLFTHGFLAYLGARRFVRRMRRQPEGFYPRI